MKRIAVMLFLAFTLFAPALVFSGHSSAVNIFENTCDKYAKDAKTNGTNAPGVCTDIEKKQTTNPIIKIIKGAINIVSVVVGVGAIIGVLASATRLIISNGDSNSSASARTGLVYSLIGIIVVLLAQAIVAFVLDKV